MVDLFKFWSKCIQEAARGSVAFANDWQWFFGIPIISGLAGYAATRLGKTELTTGHPILDGLLSAIGAFIITWLIVFLGRVFNAPVVIDRKQRNEINRLSLLAGVTRTASFSAVIEEIPLDDADRNKTYGGENLFRVAIKNLEHDKTLKAFAVLEKVRPSLGISPAAKLPAMGKGINARAFDIAPSETAYVLLLESEQDRHVFMGNDAGQPFIKFATASSDDDVWSIVTVDRIRKDKGVGEIKPNERYHITLAVHAPEAISCRLKFSMMITDEGTVCLKNDTHS